MSEPKNFGKNTVGLVLGWIFGLVFAFFTLLAIVNSDFIPATVSLVIALILLPCVNNWAKEKYGIELSKSSKTSMLCIGILLYFFILATGGSNHKQVDYVNRSNDVELVSVGTLLEKQPDYIGNLRGYEDGGKFIVSFSLYDHARTHMTASGVVEMKLLSDDGTTVYFGEKMVSHSDFGLYAQKLTGKQFVAYSLEIPLSDLKKSTDSGGRLYLKFSTSNGTKFEELETSVYGLPELSEDETLAMAELDYNKTAVVLNLRNKIDDYVAITIEKIGLMYLDGERLIRVDLIVDNIGSEKISYYSPNPVILGKSSNQFDSAYVSSYYFKNIFESGDIFPGVMKRGSMFLRTDKNPQLDIKELIIATGLSSYSKKDRNIGDGDSLYYDKEYVFKYDVSEIQLT